jgi:Fic-DOC domain mobile mystery protein B
LTLLLPRIGGCDAARASGARGPPSEFGSRTASISTRRNRGRLSRAGWTRGRRRMPVERMLTDNFMRTLHRRMFGNVWAWAGAYRSTERNVGIRAHRIAVELTALLEDVKYSIEHKTFASDGIATRFHHRLVAIHLFPNGNGRDARLASNLLGGELGSQPFTWGSGSLGNDGDLRALYVAALQAADNHDIGLSARIRPYLRRKIFTSIVAFEQKRWKAHPTSVAIVSTRPAYTWPRARLSAAATKKQSP